MNGISKIYKNQERLACITLDFEMDYGDRTGAFNLLDDEQDLSNLGQLFSDLEIPISAFIRTDCLINFPKSLQVVKTLAEDYHCHSHTHNTKHFNSEFEISTCASTFESIFGYKPLGYRAPQGVLYAGDIDLIQKFGFKFSSSVFPSYRPGKFNNLSLPVDPFVYKNGIVELPFAAVPNLRYVISLSYLKLLGMAVNRLLFSTFGLPNVIVFDSHLHDFITNEKSFEMLPWKLKAAWGIRKNSGIKYFTGFVNYLKGKGYKFITMTELYNRLRDGQV